MFKTLEINNNKNEWEWKWECLLLTYVSTASRNIVEVKATGGQGQITHARINMRGMFTFTRSSRIDGCNELGKLTILQHAVTIAIRF